MHVVARHATQALLRDAVRGPVPGAVVENLGWFDRLKLQVDVAPDLLSTPLPPMMLQTLVENAIKHGLEPKPGGGTVWLLGRTREDSVSVTVADDGLGFSEAGSGTGIGLKNVRERLALVYGGAASLSIVGNFPSGVAATITVPAKLAAEASHG